MEEAWHGKKEEQNGGGSERWNAAIKNISEMGSTVDSLQKLLLRKAVYVDEDAFAQASANSIHNRNALVLSFCTWQEWKLGEFFVSQLRFGQQCQKRCVGIKASGNSFTFNKDNPALERRVKTLEKELDAAISASAHARTEKRQVEAAQRAAEARTQEVLKELENTTKVFKIHMEELRAKQEEIAKKDGEIKVLQAIIQTLSSNGSSRKLDQK